MDILLLLAIAAISWIFKRKKKAPPAKTSAKPRRVVRSDAQAEVQTAASAARDGGDLSAPRPVAGDGELDLGRAMRQLFGIPDDESPPPRKTAAAIEAERAAAHEAEQHRLNAARMEAAAKKSRQTVARAAAKRKEIVELSDAEGRAAGQPARRRQQATYKASAQAAGRDAGAEELETVAELAASLRRNPRAARDAFVFSEIFGQPVGMRTGGGVENNW